MSVLLKRAANLETIELEAHTGQDDQGVPTYESAVEIEGRVVRVDEFVTNPDGSVTRTPLMVWVDGDEVLPDEEDRLTTRSKIFIVKERVEVRRFRSPALALDHVKLKCREEG